MRPFPLAIHSDQEAATSLLGEIAALCAAHGAQWHPDLRAEVAEGAMRLLAPHHTFGVKPFLLVAQRYKWRHGKTQKSVPAVTGNQGAKLSKRILADTLVEFSFARVARVCNKKLRKDQTP